MQPAAAALFGILPRVTFNEIPARGQKQFSLVSRMLNAASCGSGAVWAGQGGSCLAGGGGGSTSYQHANHAPACH